MKKNVKKSLALFVAAIMLLCSLPLAVSAVDTYTENGYTYTVSDGKATITKADSSVVNGAVTVPSTLGGYPVVAIGDKAFYSNKALTSVDIPESVISIGETAFGHCRNLSTLTLHEGLTTIGNQAFTYCGTLTSVDIPASVTTIESNAFYYCITLATINFLGNNIESLGISAFQSTAWFNSLPDGDVYIADHYYCYKGSMPENTTVIIKDGTKSIVDSAFENCKNLKSVILKEGLTSIERYAFFGCRALERVVIPSTVTSIGEYALGYDFNTSVGEEKIDGFIIEGYAGTAAEQYATDNGFTFVVHTHQDTNSDDVCDTCGASLKEPSALNDKTAKILTAVFEFIVFLVDAIIKLAQNSQGA